MILLTVSTLCIVYAPKVTGNIINSITANTGTTYDHEILRNINLLFILCAGGYMFKVLSNRIMLFIGEKIAYNLRLELFDNLETIGSVFIQNNSKGHVLSRLNNDLMNLREFITLHLSEIFAQILTVLCVIIMIVITDWRLSLIYLITLPINVICF